MDSAGALSYQPKWRPQRLQANPTLQAKLACCAKELDTPREAILFVCSPSHGDTLESWQKWSTVCPEGEGETYSLPRRCPVSLVEDVRLLDGAAMFREQFLSVLAEVIYAHVVRNEPYPSAEARFQNLQS